MPKRVVDVLEAVEADQRGRSTVRPDERSDLTKTLPP
jgi:hypothetical protein